MNTTELQQFLSANGLICSTFLYEELPLPVKELFDFDSNIEFNKKVLTLLANVGSEFWNALQAHTKQQSTNQNHPVDDFSALLAEQLLNENSTTGTILYPGPYPVPLIKLGQLAGWSTPSPLGLGLHPKYGPWTAYRALILTDEPLIPTELLQQTLTGDFAESPCLSCDATPCVSVCPATAVSTKETFSIDRCSTYRTQADSTCHDRCHARSACPVGVEYRYSEQQFAYHMRFALKGLQAWARKEKSNK